LIDLGNDKLPLMASLGFTPEMKREMALMDPEHTFSHEIIGLGHKIILPSLNRNGRYNIPVFKKAGFRSLIAVPIMTYRIYGILGLAYRARMRFSDEFAQLVSVIGSLVGMSLNKSMLSKQPAQKKRQPELRPLTPAKSNEKIPDNQDKTIESKKIEDTGREYQNKTEKHTADFQVHDQNMRRFNRSHK
jgi:hypothetical protein